MKKHLCGKCLCPVVPRNIEGVRFFYDTDFRRAPNAQVVGRLYIATSPEAAQPGQDEPSGECPTCHGPTFCAFTGAV